jgi:hypothetical protein
MKRVDLYTSLLKSVSIVPDEEGRLYGIGLLEGEKEPILYEDKQFVLPTKTLLSKSIAETEDYLFFDPLTESVLRQESDSLKMLKGVMLQKLQLSINMLVANLIEVLRDDSKAALAKGNQTLLYRQGIRITTKTRSSFAKLQREGIRNGITNRVVSIFFKRGGVVNGDKYSRAAIVSFPILDAIDNNLDAIFGVEMSKKDKKAILDLYSFVIYGTTEELTLKERIALDDSEFSAGSDVKMAPYFQSLCFAYCNVARRINKLEKVYKSLYDPEGKGKAMTKIKIDLDFEEHIQELNVYKKDPMPALAGNTGKERESEKAKVEGDSDGVDQAIASNATPSIARPKIKREEEVSQAPIYNQETAPPMQPRQQVRTFGGGKRFSHDPTMAVVDGSVPVPDHVRRTMPCTQGNSAPTYGAPKKKVVVVNVPEPVQEEVVYRDQYGNPLPDYYFVQGQQPLQPQPLMYQGNQPIYPGYPTQQRGGYVQQAYPPYQQGYSSPRIGSNYQQQQRGASWGSAQPLNRYTNEPRQINRHR